MAMGAANTVNAVNIGNDLVNKLSQPLYKDNKLAQLGIEKMKRAEQGDIDIVWLIIVILAIIVLGLLIWLVIWYNCCREDEEKKEEEEEKKEEDKKKEDTMMGENKEPAKADGAWWGLPLNAKSKH